MIYQKTLSSHLKEPEVVMEAILKSKVSVLPGHIQAVFIHNLMKLYAHILQKAYATGEKQKANLVIASNHCYYCTV